MTRPDPKSLRLLAVTLCCATASVACFGYVARVAWAAWAAREWVKR